MEKPIEKELVHIGIIYPDNFPDLVIENMLKDIDDEGLIIKTNKRESLVMMAALEWVMPTFFAAYILKPYFEGFLKKAGEDHYNLLKSWLKNFANEFRSIKTVKLTASQSFMKDLGQDSQSKSVSIYIQTKNDRRIKLLFDNDLSKQDWDNALDIAMDYLIQNYKEFPNDFITEKTKHLSQESYLEIYAYIDKESKEWVFVDAKEIVNLNRNQQNLETKND